MESKDRENEAMDHGVLEWIKSRRSTRAFSPDKPARQAVEMVVEAGRYAPSGANRQKTRFLVIENPEVLNELKKIVSEEFASMEPEEDMYVSLKSAISKAKAGGYDFIYDAPVLIVTANEKDAGNNIADCACALENMMLEANALDLGSVWINQLRWLNENPRLLAYLQKLGLQEDERVYGSLALGYAKDGNLVRTPLQRHGNPVDWIE